MWYTSSCDGACAIATDSALCRFGGECAVVGVCKVELFGRLVCKACPQTELLRRQNPGILFGYRFIGNLVLDEPHSVIIGTYIIIYTKMLSHEITRTP